MKKKKGFTLIELLVVIAIIGILSSIVLASLSTARTKGANAAVKSNIDGVRSQVEIVYDNTSPNSYDTVCNANPVQDPNVAKAIAAAHLASGATGAVVNDITLAQDITTSNCHSTADAWAISVPLKVPENGSNYWCTDSTGIDGGRVNPLDANSVTCPAL